MFPVEVEDCPFLPLFEPMVAWDPAVVLVHLAIPLFPVVKGPLRHAHPAEDVLSRDIGPILPVANVIDDAVAHVVARIH